MDGGNREVRDRHPPVVELDEMGRDSGVVQRRKPRVVQAAPCISGAHSGGNVAPVEAIEPACLQHGVDRFAPVAAERAVRGHARAATSHGSPQWRQTGNEASPGETAGAALSM